MGVRFRKSIKLGGGVRINLSKSGVGYSWGVPGYRHTKTAKGRTRKTYSIPGTGLSYVTEKGKDKKKQTTDSKTKIMPRESKKKGEDLEYSDIASAEIKNFQSGDYENIIRDISRIILLDNIATILSLCLLLFFAPNKMFIFVGGAGVIMKIFVRTKMKFNFEYEMDEDSKTKYNERMGAWKKLDSSCAVWQIVSQANIENTKASGGASRNIRREKIRISNKAPFYINTDVKIIVLHLKKEKIILLPDKILILQNGKIGVEDYENTRIRIGTTYCNEYNTVEKDATVVEYTWQYINKNGEPDKRYSKNRKIPVCKYGKILITSKSGINTELQCSNYKLTDELNNLF